MKYCPICKHRYVDSQTYCSVDGVTLLGCRDSLVGTLIGARYRVLREIGTGGMSTVYQMIEEQTGALRALKVLSSGLTHDPVQRHRFLRESRVAERIEHENIIKVFDSGETADGLLFMVMEYLPGIGLEELVSPNGLGLDELITIGTQVARGLAYAHDLGVIHRDIKPDNVIFASLPGEPCHVKLVDFGLAWMQGDPRITATGEIFGTPEYLSPEQATGEPASALSDLYSLGVLFFEMATGHPPFEGSSTHVLMHHLEKAPPVPSEVSGNASLPREFDALVLRLLEKKPEDRYRDVHHLIEELKAISRWIFGDQEPKVVIHYVGDAGLGAKKTAQRSQPESPVFRVTERLRALEREYARRARKMLPAWVTVCVEDLAVLVKEIKELEKRVRDLSIQRAEAEQTMRKKRESIGQEINAIAEEESRLKRELSMRKERMETLERDMRGGRSLGRYKVEELGVGYENERERIEATEVYLAEVSSNLHRLRARMGAINAEFEHDKNHRWCNIGLGAERLEQLVLEFDPVATRIERLWGMEKNTR